MTESSPPNSQPDSEAGAEVAHTAQQNQSSRASRAGPNRDLDALRNRHDSHTSVPHHYGSTERTPLLDPDDSAVSVYNLQSIRVLRRTLWVFVVISAIVALLLFINSFVSIPYLELRTSGFLEFDLLVLSLVTLLLSLLFFSEASEADVWLGYIVTGASGLQFILGLAIPHIRHFYGAIGLFIFAWTFVAIGLCLVVTPYSVKVSRGYEEERLTGRAENRHTLGQWFKMSFSFLLKLIVVALPAILFFAGFLLDIYDTSRLLHDDKLAANGIFVPIRQGTSDYSVYIECTSEPATTASIATHPVVLIEADDRVSAQTFYFGWVKELHDSKKIGQVCFWNRPGRAFSDVAPSPFSLNASTDALTVALEKALSVQKNSTDADIELASSPPFQNKTLALVSHGLGGLYSRAFAARHIDSVQSLFLVNTLHEDYLRKSIAPTSRGFNLWLKGIVSPFYVRRQLSWILHHKGPASRFLSGGSGKGGITGGRAGLAFSSTPSEIKASLQEQIAASNGLTEKLIHSANKKLEASKIPVAVVSSKQTIQVIPDWSSLQRQLTKVTNNNVAWEIFDGPHELWLDEKAKYQLQTLFTNILQEPKAI